MDRYILIESQNPVDFAGVSEFYALAERLVREGNKVTLFLVRNGVLPARSGTREERLAQVAGNGVEILADVLSLEERGIPDDQLIDGVNAVSLDVVVGHLADGSKAIWH